MNYKDININKLINNFIFFNIFVYMQVFNSVNARKLRKSYLWNKKIRLAVYKIITYLPKIISGNYKRKAVKEN